MIKGHYYTSIDDDSEFFTEGKHYKVTGILKNGNIFIENDGGKIYSYDEFLFKELFKKAPVLIKEKTLYVGCMVENEDGRKVKVLDVNENLVALSLDNSDEYCSHYTWEELKNYTVVEEEMTIEQICKELGRTIKLTK